MIRCFLLLVYFSFQYVRQHKLVALKQKKTRTATLLRKFVKPFPFTAFLALIIAAFTCWKQFIQYSPELRISMLEASIIAPKPFPLVNLSKTGPIYLGSSSDKLAFLNDGNRPVLVTNIFFHLLPTTLKEIDRFNQVAPLSARIAALPSCEKVQPVVTEPYLTNRALRKAITPFVIKPGEYQLFDTYTDLQFDNIYEQYRRKSDQTQYVWCMRVQYLDASGEPRFRAAVAGIVYLYFGGLDSLGNPDFRETVFIPLTRGCYGPTGM